MTVPVSFHDYLANRASYGQVATWCAWQDGEGAEYLQTESSEAFEERLASVLHKQAVVLSYHFDCGTDDVLEAVSGLRRPQELPVYGNMYEEMRPHYGQQMAGTSLWGAYATAFFKFGEGQSPTDKPEGVPAPLVNLIPEWYLTDAGIDLQVQGLKNELQGLGIGDDPVFVLTSKRLENPRVLTALRREFPGMSYGTIYHFQYRNARLLGERLKGQIDAVARLVPRESTDLLAV